MRLEEQTLQQEAGARIQKHKDNPGEEGAGKKKADGSLPCAALAIGDAMSIHLKLTTSIGECVPISVMYLDIVRSLNTI